MDSKLVAVGEKVLHVITLYVTLYFIQDYFILQLPLFDVIRIEVHVVSPSSSDSSGLPGCSPLSLCPTRRARKLL